MARTKTEQTVRIIDVTLSALLILDALYVAWLLVESNATMGESVRRVTSLIRLAIPVLMIVSGIWIFRGLRSGFVMLLVICGLTVASIAVFLVVYFFSDGEAGQPFTPRRSVSLVLYIGAGIYALIRMNGTLGDKPLT